MFQHKSIQIKQCLFYTSITIIFIIVNKKQHNKVNYKAVEPKYDFYFIWKVKLYDTDLDV